MAQKVLFETQLTDLRTTDVEGVGSLRYDDKGNIDKWVKNGSSTALVAAGSCLEHLGSTAAGTVGTKVTSPDAGASTGIVNVPAGVPHTGIGASGTDTGCFGWIRVEGVKKVSIFQAVTALSANLIALATSTGGWGKPATFTVGVSVPPRYVETVGALATTGAATAGSCVCFIKCL